VVPQLRPLHFLQGLIYVAIVILARRRNISAYGAGIFIAVVWNSLNLFVTHLMLEGSRLFWSWIHTGQLQRVDTMLVTMGGIGHFILIAGCVAAMVQEKSEPKKWRKFATGATATLVYFGAIVALARPK
jgi:hypothetical protein